MYGWMYVWMHGWMDAWWGLAKDMTRERIHAHMITHKYKFRCQNADPYQCRCVYWGETSCCEQTPKYELTKLARNAYPISASYVKAIAGKGFHVDVSVYPPHGDMVVASAGASGT